MQPGQNISSAADTDFLGIKYLSLFVGYIGWTARGLNSGGRARDILFSTFIKTTPWRSDTRLYNGHRAFPGAEGAG